MAEDTFEMTVENVDRLYPEIVVNGESHSSQRYVAPQQGVQPVSASSAPSQQSGLGEDVYAVELNEILHNIKDQATAVLQGDIDTINSKIPSSASSTNQLADTSSVNTAIESAINALDVAQAGGSGKFIQAVSEADGKISATEGTIDSTVSSGSDNPVSGGAVHTAIGTVQTSVQGIQALIPAQASDQNQLADKNFVNSSIATNTANFIGTFESVTLLRAYSGTVTNNDYAFVVNEVVQYNGGDFPNVTTLNNYDKTTLTNGDYAWVVNSEDNTKYDLYRFDIVEQSWVLRNTKIDKSADVLNSFYNRYKATVASSVVTWAYEYTLNNSSFTASQWATINSGLTSTSVSDAINALDVSSVGGAGKYIQAISEANGKISATEQTMDTAPTQNSTNACTSGGIYTAIQNASGGTIDTAMSDSSTNAVQNKVIKSYVDTSVTNAITTVLNTYY